jgi:hypothetical protein
MLRIRLEKVGAKRPDEGTPPISTKRRKPHAPRRINLP